MLFVAIIDTLSVDVQFERLGLGLGYGIQGKSVIITGTFFVPLTEVYVSVLVA